MKRLTTDVLILGAGAAGMMCAIEAARRGRSTIILDHAKKPGEKIRISGGGRCNFTNLSASPENFISRNPHFCKSALKRYTQHDFIAMVDAAGIDWHEKTLGQLFCNGSSQEIIDMLLSAMKDAGAELLLDTSITKVSKTQTGFSVMTGKRTGFPDSSTQEIICHSLVVATGGKSIPKMGATGIGYDIADQFGLAMTAVRPALVPLTFDPEFKKAVSELSGVSCDANVHNDRASFDEAMLFTHRGMSGPSILQISSFWREGETVGITFNHAAEIPSLLENARNTNPRQAPHTVLAELFPKRLVALRLQGLDLPERVAELSNTQRDAIVRRFSDWQVMPAGSEGYRTAEVTLGGVDTDELNSRTMEARKIPGLYFIGEVVDVTGWLGGYNFQWAWSSGWAAGQAV